MALGRKPMISTRPFPLTRTARFITGHPLPPNPLTDTREVSSSPITLVDLNFPLVLESLPLETSDDKVVGESGPFTHTHSKMGELTYPFRDSCYLYVLIHLLQESHYSIQA